MSRVWSTLYSSFTSYIFWCKGNFLSLRVTWPKNIKIQHWEALIEKKAVQISGKFCRLQAHHHQLVFKHSSLSVHFHQDYLKRRSQLHWTLSLHHFASSMFSVIPSTFILLSKCPHLLLSKYLIFASLISSDLAMLAFVTIFIHLVQGLSLTFLPSTSDSYFLLVNRSPHIRFTCTNDF